MNDSGLHIEYAEDNNHFFRGTPVMQTIVTSTRPTPPPVRQQVRIGNRRKICVPGRLTWRDASGTLRFVSVLTRDVSDVDVFVECQVPASIPLYRLVHFQIERPARECMDLPVVLKHGKVLSAVYRVGPYRSATGTPQGYALRLLIEPGRAAAPVRRAQTVAAAN